MTTLLPLLILPTSDPFELLVSLHHLVQLLLGALKLAKTLNEVRVHRALQLVCVLDKLDKPVTIRRQIFHRLKLLR